MTKKNPFPGMNPYFEQGWRDAHTMLIAYIHDALQQRLPEDLMVRAEEEIVTIGGGESSKTYRPDVRITEPWKLKEPGAAPVASQPPPTPIPQPPPTPATEPILVYLDDDTERWLEIRDSKGRLITVFELLSPTNKLELEERDRYLHKRRALMGGGVNLVEIDLVRQGTWLFPVAIRSVLHKAGASYGVSVFTATRRGEYAAYPIRLRERLPAIRVPLRPADADVVLDLQPLIDQCHERGRYHFLDYRSELNPPLSPEDAQWANQLLREHGLL